MPALKFALILAIAILAAALTVGVGTLFAADAPTTLPFVVAPIAMLAYIALWIVKRRE